jgi:hypothetical protein
MKRFLADLYAGRFSIEHTFGCAFVALFAANLAFGCAFSGCVALASTTLGGQIITFLLLLSGAGLLFRTVAILRSVDNFPEHDPAGITYFAIGCTIVMGLYVVMFMALFVSFLYFILNGLA